MSNPVRLGNLTNRANAIDSKPYVYLASSAATYDLDDAGSYGFASIKRKPESEVQPVRLEQPSQQPANAVTPRAGTSSPKYDSPFTPEPNESPLASPVSPSSTSSSPAAQLPLTNTASSSSPTHNSNPDSQKLLTRSTLPSTSSASQLPPSPVASPKKADDTIVSSEQVIPVIPPSPSHIVVADKDAEDDGAQNTSNNINSRELDEHRPVPATKPVANGSVVAAIPSITSSVPEEELKSPTPAPNEPPRASGSISIPRGPIRQRARRQSILDTAPASSRCVLLKHANYVPPQPTIDGKTGKTKKIVPFCSNQIRSARYTWYNFLPLNLAQQLMRPANFYFICIAILQVIPAISISGGKPTILLPLVFVLVVSALKDGVEDLKRSKADREENERIYQKFVPIPLSKENGKLSTAAVTAATIASAQLKAGNTPTGQGAQCGSFQPVACKDIVVGDILKIYDEQAFPADLYLLYSSLEQSSTNSETTSNKAAAFAGGLHEKRSSMKRSSTFKHVHQLDDLYSTNPNMYGGSYAYVETSNLDGESNLKIKLVTEFTRDLCDEPSLVAGTNLDLRVEAPNGLLDKFGGMVLRQILDEESKVDGNAPLSEQVLTLDNLLLRGSRLRNTGFVYGLALYTGEESKIRLNSRARAMASVKRSSVERLMNQQIYVMFVLQVAFCFVGGLLAGLWQRSHDTHTYLFVFTSPSVVGLQRFFTWYVIFSGFVPISLLVSLEVVKFAQGIFMGLDKHMCHHLPEGSKANKRNPLKTQNSNIPSNSKGRGSGMAGRSSGGAVSPAGHLGLAPGTSAGPLRKSSSASDGGMLISPSFSTTSTASNSSTSSFDPDDVKTDLGELQFARAQTSGLNEELGMVGWCFSDKTGTLTCNSMDFRKAFIGQVQYGTGTTDMMSAVALAKNADPATIDDDAMDSWEDTLLNIEGPTNNALLNVAIKFSLPHSAPHVNFNARDQVLLSLLGVSRANEENTTLELKAQQKKVHSYFMALSLCNSVFPTVNEYEKVVYKASSPDEESLVEFARFVGYELAERSPPFVTVSLSGPAAFVGQDVTALAKANAELNGGVTAEDPLTEGGLFQRNVEYEQLALLDFTSKRKRMSVIMRNAEGNIEIMCKGADVTVLPLLSAAYSNDTNQVPDWNATSGALTRFSDEGLRTLVVCTSTKPAAWWDDPIDGWSFRYAKRMKEVAVEGPNEEGHFKGACKAACRRCAIEEDLELSAGLSLIGGTAIEDKLQAHVPATIKMILDAGIKVWILTGDKLETAEKIGMACNLLETAMEREGNLLKIEGDSIEAVTKQVNDCYKHVRRLVARTKPGNVNKDPDEPDVEPPLAKGQQPRPLLSPLAAKLPRPVGLVLESHAYALIMSSVPTGQQASPLLRKFLYVATHCKSVVACRCQPSTKSSIVGLIKQTQQVTTLAIGDGANDEQMIRAASVGVGIRGVEGTTAVQASDYAISQFHFLRRLLFVHGRLSLRRVSILICYIFYKTTLMCFCVFWYGIFSGFSGQNLVMEWAYQLYNVIFTSLPILIFAVFDRDMPAEVLQMHPDIYRISSSPFGHFFNARIFWSRWMLLSFVHSIIIFFFPYAVYQSYSVEPSGQSQGMWEMGIVLYTCVVLTTNLKLALLFRSWTWLHHISLWGSILVYFGAMLVLNLSSIFGTAGGDYFGAVSRLLRTPSFWVTVVITVVSALYFDVLLETVDRFRENKEQNVRYAQLIKRNRIRSASYKKSKKKQSASVAKSKSQRKISMDRIEDEKQAATPTFAAASAAGGFGNGSGSAAPKFNSKPRPEIPGVNRDGQHGGGIIDRAVVVRAAPSEPVDKAPASSSSSSSTEVELIQNPALANAYDEASPNIEMHIIRKEPSQPAPVEKSTAPPTVIPAAAPTTVAAAATPVVEKQSTAPLPAASTTTITAATSSPAAPTVPISVVVAPSPAAAAPAPAVAPARVSTPPRVTPPALPPYDATSTETPRSSRQESVDDVDTLSQPLPLLSQKTVLPTIAPKTGSSVIPRFQPLSTNSSSVSPFVSRTPSSPTSLGTSAFGPLISPSHHVISSIAARSSMIHSNAASPQAAAAAAAANSFAAAASRLIDTTDTIVPSPRPGAARKWDEPLEPHPAFHSGLSSPSATAAAASATSPSSSSSHAASSSTDPTSPSNATLFVRRERGSVSLLSSIQRGPVVAPASADETPPTIAPYPF